LSQFSHDRFPGSAVRLQNDTKKKIEKSQIEKQTDFSSYNSFGCDKITDYGLTLTKQKSGEQAHSFPVNFDGRSFKQVTGK